MAGRPQPKKVYKQEGSGRPSKFTPERRAAIVQSIRNRLPYQMAAEANGITEACLYMWLQTSRQHVKEGIDSEYSQFFHDIKKAEADRASEHLTKIADNIERWQGDAWILERRWYKHFGANAQVNELNRRLDALEGVESDGKPNLMDGDIE